MKNAGKNYLDLHALPLNIRQGNTAKLPEMRHSCFRYCPKAFRWEEKVSGMPSLVIPDFC